MTRVACIALLAGLTLGGCSSDGVTDALSSLNPFDRGEALLPGTRTAVLPGTDPVGSLGGQQGTVSIGPAGAVDWSQPGGTPANNPGNVTAGSSGVAVWRTAAVRLGGGFSLGFGGGVDLRVAARPVAVDGRAIVFAPDGTVSAFSLANGGTAWTATIRPEGEADPVSGGGVAGAAGRVFVATGYGEAAALDSSSGAVAWRVDLEAPARGAPTAAGGFVYVVTKTDTVVALNQADGSVAWTYRGISSGANLLAAASPAFSGDTVVVPGSGGDIVALATADGAERWVASIAGGGRTLAVTGIGDASASPVIADGTVYATGAGGKLVALRLSDGARLWQAAVGSAHTPILSGSAVFIVDLDDRAVAFDRTSGEIRWATQLPVVREGRNRSTFAGPLLANGTLWFVSDDETIAFVDAPTGTLRGTADLGVPGFLSPIASNGVVLVLGGDGTLLALN